MDFVNVSRVEIELEYGEMDKVMEPEDDVIKYHPGMEVYYR